MQILEEKSLKSKADVDNLLFQRFTLLRIELANKVAAIKFRLENNDGRFETFYSKGYLEEPYMVQVQVISLLITN